MWRISLAAERQPVYLEGSNSGELVNLMASKATTWPPIEVCRCIGVITLAWELVFWRLEAYLIASESSSSGIKIRVAFHSKIWKWKVEQFKSPL
jgi:hypothetical protein